MKGDARACALLFPFPQNVCETPRARTYNNNNGNDNAQSRKADMNMYQVHLLPRNPPVVRSGKGARRGNSISEGRAFFAAKESPGRAAG
jgi:hypothetical protein